MRTTLKEKKLKDSKSSNANVVNTTENSSSDEEVCALSIHSHFDLNYALHPKHPNAIGSFSGSKIERNWFIVTNATHTMSFATISRAEITKSNVATWSANFGVTKHMTNGLDWFTCLKPILEGLLLFIVTNDQKLWVQS
jgi:hypothetical protein